MGISTKLLLAISILGDHCCSDHHISHLLPAEKESICQDDYKPNKILLKEDKAHVVTYESVDYREWNGKVDFNCILHIQSPESMGVVAVIQQMSLRRDPIEPNCTDYIQFRHSEEKYLEKLLNLKLHKRPSWELPICGDLEPLREPVTPIADAKYASTAFVDPKGYIEVKIHLAKKRLKSDEKIGFQIVFTASQNCRNSSGKLKACTPELCLSNVFFNDTMFLNCPTTYCMDEKCKPINSDDSHSERVINSIIVTAGVLSVMVSFVIFLGCYIACRSMELCWVVREGSRSHDRATELSQVEPTAPPETPSPDKDLPPAYEALFPER